MPAWTSFGADPPDRAALSVVGCGGAGCNALLDLPPTAGVEPVALNDYPHPSLEAVPRRVLTRTQPLEGIAATHPKATKRLETDVERDLAAHLRPAGLVVILAGLGGDTGTWAASIAARVATLLGATTLAVATLPFTVEGLDRRTRAREGFKLLHARAHAVLPFANDGLLKVAPNLPILKAFQVMDHILLKPLTDLSRVLTVGDLPRLRRILQACRHWRVGIGEGRGEHRFYVAVDEALQSPWMDIPLEKAREALVFIEGQDLSRKECTDVLEELARACPAANVTWGAIDRQDKGMPAVRVSLILGA